MTKSTKTNLFFWLTILGAILLSAYLLANVLTPFLIAFLFAYILQPVIESLVRKYKFSREFVTIGIFALFVSAFISLIVILSPLIYKQITTLIKRIPSYQEIFERKIKILVGNINETNPEFANKISEGANMLITGVFDLFSSLANQLWHVTMVTISFVTIAGLVPIILYYFLRDWLKMIDSIESVLPLKGKGKVHEIVESINELISAYVRGQLNICIALSCYYIIGFHVIGLDFALLLGIMSGFFIIIPFIGAFFSFAIVVTSCYLQYDLGMEVAYIITMFTIGHSVEGYIVAPKVIGDRIGLHPLWIIFSVFASGALFGIIGIVFAIPIAGILKLLILHGLDYYKASKIFKG